MYKHIVLDSFASTEQHIYTVNMVLRFHKQLMILA